MEANPGEPGGSRGDPWEHLTPANAERLAAVLRDQVAEAFRMTRVIEQKTGYTSEIGKNMFVDVLSHLSTLAQPAGCSSEEEQKSQIVKIEEHVRRAILEHPEEVLHNRIADVDKLWVKYQRAAVPFRNAGALHGAPLHRDLEEDRNRIAALLESSRSAKPSETTWDESVEIAAQVTQAADVAGELADKLNQCIGEAHRLQRDEDRERSNKRRWAVGILVAIALAVGAYFAGRADNHGAAPSASPADQAQPSR